MAETPALDQKLVLHLGVLVQPYRYGNKAITTADVAAILEAHYGIFTAFFRTHQKDIAASLENSIAGSLETMMMRGYISAPQAAALATAAYNQAMQDIQKMFNDFISSKEAERVGIPGTPTMAALMGINHRFKHPHTGIRRPSFKDTGLFMSSMRSWIE